MDIKTLSGEPASVMGLAGQDPMEMACVDLAYQSGINYFFFYNLSFTNLLQGLKPLVASQREHVILATGSESRDLNDLSQYLESVRSLLNIERVDAFFLEYVSPEDDWAQVMVTLEHLQSWKVQGLIRYVGVTTHNRDLALKLISNQACDVLMHRYNMAHRKAEAEVFPAAIQAGMPMVAFTATRWSSLLKGHPDWQQPTPHASDCYRMALQHPAIHLVLTAPKTEAELIENLAVLKSPRLSAQAVTQWQAYGDLVYGSGQDSFETQWL